MRSRIFFSAALPCLGLCLSFSSIAHAADPKAKKKSSTEISDDKGIGKTLSWEEKVMGDDDNKKSELDKILKAQAINKAATEKAERDKAKNEAAAAKEAAREAAAPKPAKKNSEVSIGALPDEGPSKGTSKAKATEISSKLDSAAAAAPPPPTKPADDKFIDKLLKEDGGAGKKKRASATDDWALQDILAGEKKAAPVKGKGKKSDVDNLLENAEKEPDVVAPKVKHETPEWAKPEIQSTPTPAPVIARPAPRRDDGIIRVVQGAAGGGGAKPLPPPPAEPVASRSAPTSRKQPPVPAARGGRASGNWDDPFATESTAPKKPTASRAAHPSNDDDLFAPAPRKTVAARASDDDDFAPAKRTATPPAAAKRGAAKSESWDDPFADGASKPANKHVAAPARPVKSEPAARSGNWKDPFGDDSAKAGRRPAAEAPAKTARKTSVARETASSKDDSKWAAAQRGADDADGADAAPAHGRWGILKKRAH